jgi:hypothetical protein
VRHIEGGVGPRDKLGAERWATNGGRGDVSSSTQPEESGAGSDDDDTVSTSPLFSTYDTQFGTDFFTVSQLDPRALAERHAGVIKLFADTSDVAQVQVGGFLSR